MAQLDKHPALDFVSGRDLTVHGMEPHVRLCADSAEPACDSFSPSLSAPPPLVCAPTLSLFLILSHNRFFKIFFKNNTILISISFHWHLLSDPNKAGYTANSL